MRSHRPPREITYLQEIVITCISRPLLPPQSGPTMAALLPALSLLLPLAASASGLLVVGSRPGGAASRSAEVWALPPEENHCTRPDIPFNRIQSTEDTEQGRIITCYRDSCLELTGSGWEAGPSTLHERQAHTSAVTAEGLLLAGGYTSPTTTELLPAGGGPSRESFSLQPGRKEHCSIQLSADTIVLTGGWGTESLVNEHSGLGTGGEVTTRELPALLTPRHYHACGVYTVGGAQVWQGPFLSHSGSQMLIVTGGVPAGFQPLASTEVMAHPEGSWREAGPLPSVRPGLLGATLAGVFHVTGGWDVNNYLDEILAWDPVAETWSLAGHLATARYWHGITEVSLAALEGICAAHP
jgi:hypothetical protein